MAIQKLTIKNFLQQSKNHLLLDVRSPGEYNHAHIPSAINLPLFTDEERKIVGTAYKQKNREAAIKIGLNFFAPKMVRMVEEVEERVGSWQLAINSNNSGCQPATVNSVFIYCWRGGMRSAAVAWLLDLYGYKVYTLAGGYKSFRNHVVQTFEQSFQFKVLGGFTGSGKTEVLKELKKRGQKIIDLEHLACHKGSAFGSFKMPQQPTQEMFENILAHNLGEVKSQTPEVHDLLTPDLLPLASYIWLEDESQRIGNLNIPSALWKTMRQAPVFFLDISFEERLKHIVQEYGDCDKEKLIESVRRISPRLGGLNTKNTIEFLQAGNSMEAFRILLTYYDKFYLKGLHNRENLSALLTKVQCKTVTSENASLLIKHQPA